MSEKTSAELEQEAETARFRMTETAETLQRKLSPGQLVDEITHYFRNSDGKVAFDNLKTQVRDNPLPLAMIGAGFAWLFMGSGAGARSQSSSKSGNWRDPSETGRYGTTGAEVWEGAPGLDAADTSGDSGGALTERMGSAYGAAGSAASSTASSVGEGVRNAGHRASEAGRYASGQMRRTGKVLSDTMEQEPLILGALGIAVGAAIGAMLPRTQAEDTYLRPYGEKVRENAKEAVDRGLEKTRSAVSTAMKSDTASEENASEKQMAESTSREEAPETAPGSPGDLARER